MYTLKTSFTNTILYSGDNLETALYIAKHHFKNLDVGGILFLLKNNVVIYDIMRSNPFEDNIVLIS